MLPALYELSSEFIEASNALQNLDLDDQCISNTLEGLQYPVEQKCNNVAFVVRNLESLAEQIKQAEQQMAARRKAIENRAANVREYLLQNMERCGISKIESPYFKISIRNNPASVVVDDAGAIPCEFYRYPEAPPPSPDKKLLLDALKSGINISGVHLEHKTRLDIK